MSRYYWRDMLGEADGADEDTQKLARKLRRLTEQGWAMSGG